MMNYSQHGDEQDFILNYFQGKSDGFFLDIGAGDGWNDSNTRALFDSGWNGILVEANYTAFKQLMEVYGNTDRALLIFGAISTSTRIVQFYEHPETGWSSLEPCLGDRKDYQHKPRIGLRIGAIIQDVDKVDFLSIDVEGHEAELLNTMPDYMRPKLIMAESDKVGTMSAQDVLGLRGYRSIWKNIANEAFEYAPDS